MELDMLPKVNVCSGSQPLGDNSKGGGGSVEWFDCGHAPPVGASPRREFSARTKRQAWERANGCCEGIIWSTVWNPHYKWPKSEPVRRCNAPIDIGNFHYDHINPDWFCKDNGLNNCQVLCEQCHCNKTKRDIKDIAKSKRIIKKRMKAIGGKKGGFRAWRRFDGTIVVAKRVVAKRA